MIRRMPHSHWLSAIATLESIRKHIQEHGAMETHLRTEKAMQLLRDQRNPVAAGATLTRIADETPGMPVVNSRIRELADVLMEFAAVALEDTQTRAGMRNVGVRQQESHSA